MTPALLVAVAVAVASARLLTVPPRHHVDVAADEILPARRPRLSRRRRRTLSVAIGASVVAIAAGPWALAVAAPTWWIGRRCQRVLSERSSAARIEHALPVAIELLVLVVHAGMTPHQAVSVLEQRAPRAVRMAFGEVRRRVALGEPLADALGALPAALGPAATGVADTLALAERHGTPIAPVLEQLSRDASERRRRNAEADARKLPIKMSVPLVVCTLPSVVCLAVLPAVLAALSTLSTESF